MLERHLLGKWGPSLGPPILDLEGHSPGKCTHQLAAYNLGAYNLGGYSSRATGFGSGKPLTRLEKTYRSLQCRGKIKMQGEQKCKNGGTLNNAPVACLTHPVGGGRRPPSPRPPSPEIYEGFHPSNLPYTSLRANKKYFERPRY